MFGIGKKTAPKLKELGINTIGDVANYDNYNKLRQIIGKKRSSSLSKSKWY